MVKNNKSFSNHCIEMFEVYSQYIDGELTPAEKQEIELHISTCSECQSCIATLKKTRELCSGMPRIKTPGAFSKKLHERIQKLINKE